MTTFLVASGTLAWVLLFLVVALTVALRPRRFPVLRSLMAQPSIYPYASFLHYRFLGTWLRLIRASRRRGIAPEIVDAYRSTRLADTKALRDALLEVDGLPTVERGKSALGLSSVFELSYRTVRAVPSPYTHPLQAPPYFLPGVPSRSFHDPADYEWVEPLERAFPVIRGELLRLLESDGVGFKAYVDERERRIQGWNSFNFFFYGEKVEENCALCPETTYVLESLPRFEKDHVMFSALNPHSHIPPHYGPMNGIIRAHLPLIVPPGCYIKVGDQERTWVEGEVLIFDDSYQHQVWNHGDGLRVVLFMNFWDPCFSQEEIAALERFRRAYERTPESRVHERNQAAPRRHDVAVAART